MKCKIKEIGCHECVAYRTQLKLTVERLMKIAEPVKEYFPAPERDEFFKAAKSVMDMC